MNHKPSERTTIKRIPERASYDKETIQSILTEGMVAHVGLTTNTGVVVIPMTYGFDETNLYIHGSPASRLLRESNNNHICATITILDGLVLARSLFHHSMNYRSLVVMGEAEKIEESDQKEYALDLIVENLIPGRVENTRSNSEKEIISTLVLKLPINEASVKIRLGSPIDDDEDHLLDTWAGVLPLKISFGKPEPDPLLRDGIEIPEHVSTLIQQ